MVIYRRFYGKKIKTPQERARLKGKIAEKRAKAWLESKEFTVDYWHEGKASNKPYDIICHSGKHKYAIDVKTGKNPSVSLKNFNNLLNKSIADIRLETKNSNLKKITRIGYIFVIGSKCYLLEYNKMKHIAEIAVSKRRNKKKY